AEGGALRRMLMAAGALVLRGHPIDLLPPVANIVVGSVSEGREIFFDLPPVQVSTWNLSATVTRPTSMRIVVPWWTYEQVNAMYAGQSYGDVKAARPGSTYLDWLRDPTPQ